MTSRRRIFSATAVVAASDEEKKEECEPSPSVTEKDDDDDRKATPGGTSETSRCPPSSESPSSPSSPSPKETTQPKACRGRGRAVASTLGRLLRVSLVDVPLVVLFALFVSATLLRRLHDEYFRPQLDLMQFRDASRDYTDTTYYHRRCDASDVSARTVEELVVPSHYSASDASEHMLRHGASVYQDLLTNGTASALREWIDRENRIQKGWFVIKNKHRYSWGIDMNMHPLLQTFWRELLAHPQLLGALQEIVGPDPAVIEFTAITSSYGAAAQHDHADVVPPGSAAKFARAFVPSYSLFVPLQDTTYEMGATHVCPGTHLCSEVGTFCSDGGNVALSGPKGTGAIWPMGWGALLNQQTTHRGMGYTQKGGIDRVVLIATFAPRPQTARTVETRMIGQGGSYSLIWHQWGHTLYDYVNADKRMTEPQKTLRSMGLIKANGWNWPTVTSFRVANEDSGYTEDSLYDFINEEGFPYLPKSWQAGVGEDDKEEDDKEAVDKEDEANGDMKAWDVFLFETIKRSEKELRKLNVVVGISYLVALSLLDLLFWARKKSHGAMFMRGLGRIFLTHGLIVLAAWIVMNHIDETQWAKAIKAKKSFRIPVTQLDDGASVDLPPSTLPDRTDILLAPHYVSELLGSYGRVVDFAHPGNSYWREVTSEYATGYSALTRELQVKFCDSLVDWIQTERRFLKQDQVRFWTRVVADDELRRFCDRELKMSVNPLSEAMFRALGELKSETEFGRWRGMAIYQRTSTSYLEHIEELLFPKGGRPATSRSKSKVKSLTIGSFLREVPESVSFQRRFTLPAAPSPTEPFPGAWLQEGDMVEVQYRCRYNEWYAATITSVIPNEAMFNVEYLDGEEFRSVMPRCLRRFEPYRPGNDVEASVAGTDRYLRGKVIAVLFKDGVAHFDVGTEEGVMKMVTADRLRRFQVVPVKPLEVGSLVMARFGGGVEAFPGRIHAVHKDGTFGVLYDDGDYEPRLSNEFVEHR